MAKDEYHSRNPSKPHRLSVPVFSARDRFPAGTEVTLSRPLMDARTRVRRGEAVMFYDVTDQSGRTIQRVAGDKLTESLDSPQSVP